MKKREAKFQELFNKYLRQSGLRGYFELKETSAGSIAYAKFEPHQIGGLVAAEEGGFVWKLSDEDMRQKPFDCFSCPPQKSYVVIKFSKVCVIIYLLDFLKERGKKLPSLKRERAEEIAFKVIHI